MIRSRCLLTLLLLASAAPCQNNWAVAGAGQALQDPFFGGGPFIVETVGKYCPLTFGLHFEFIGVPVGYSHGAINYETCHLAFNGGAPTGPAPILQGLFYVPLTPSPVVLNGGQSLYIGPGDVVCQNGSGIGTGAASNRQGALFVLGAIPPGTFGTFTAQGFLFDGNLGRFFTANAVTFTIP